MKTQFKCINLKSPGLISTYGLVYLLSGLFLYSAFNVFRNDGSQILLIILFVFGSISPVLIYLHSLSRIIIEGDKLIKKSIISRKEMVLTEFKVIHIIETTITKTMPTVKKLKAKKAKKEKWNNFFKIRHIILSTNPGFKPSRSNMRKKGIVSLPYYSELYDILAEKIKKD